MHLIWSQYTVKSDSHWLCFDKLASHDISGSVISTEAMNVSLFYTCLHDRMNTRNPINVSQKDGLKVALVIGLSIVNETALVLEQQEAVMAGESRWDELQLGHLVKDCLEINNYWLVTIWLNQKQNRQQVLVLDTVGHNILHDCFKSKVGASGKVLDWFSSYLLNRTQCGSINGTLSDSFELKWSVPQGSCLGPLLFVIYASKLFDIMHHTSPQCSLLCWCLVDLPFFQSSLSCLWKTFFDFQ